MGQKKAKLPTESGPEATELQPIRLPQTNDNGKQTDVFFIGDTSSFMIPEIPTTIKTMGVNITTMAKP